MITSLPWLKGMEVALSSVKCAWLHFDLMRILLALPLGGIFGYVPLKTGSRMLYIITRNDMVVK